MSDGQNDTHLQVLEGLPWYVTGRLDGVEEARIREHLARCEDCRRELQREVALQALLGAQRRHAEGDDAAGDADAAFARLERRIHDAAARPVGRDAPGARTRPARVGWNAGLTWRTAAVLAGVAALGGVIESAWLAPHYRSATAAALPAPNGTRLRLVLAPRSPVGDWVAWLTAERARVVDGPAPNGAWTVALPERLDAVALQAQLTRWRARAGVELVEPVDGPP